MNRRRFLQMLAPSAAALAFGGAGYGFYEASSVSIERPTFALAGLPKPLDGVTVAFLTDILHGPYQDDEYLRAIVRTTNLLDPDVIVLGGNYALRDPKHIRPTFELLKDLRAPMGKFGVLGSHDHRLGADAVRDGMKRARIADLSDAGAWLARGRERIRLASADDTESGTESRILVHNDPAIAETVRDPRVKLVLGSINRGGQLNVPGVGSPWAGKYAAGFVKAPETMAYVSRGLGVAGLPVRYGSRPEITLLTVRV
ncbi:MAG: hypothetical protein KF873_20190 [Gemmataceae bacterium]|nr:hypothetical protein [Planctomycetia bacterium]MBX3401061.1 hypothetical protein [Gemmataceae bacterium]